MERKSPLNKLIFFRSIIKVQEEAKNPEPVSDEIKELVAKTSHCGCKSKAALEKLYKKYEEIK